MRFFRQCETMQYLALCGGIDVVILAEDLLIHALRLSVHRQKTQSVSASTGPLPGPRVTTLRDQSLDVRAPSVEFVSLHAGSP